MVVQPPPLQTLGDPVALRRPGRVLAALLGAMFLGNVDVAIANIAGPSISTGLHASDGELELIVSGYTLAFAVLLIPSAQLGAARGCRATFLVGLAGFTAASLACGVAQTALTLIVARVAAGAFAALMTAQVLTGIQLGFRGRERARALGWYSTVLSAGAVAGQSLGAMLISANVLGTAWRPAFLVNVPMGLLLLWLAWSSLPAGRREPRRVDVAGLALLSAAMLLLVLPLVLGRDAGWPTWVWACMVASGPAFAAFWLVERRVSDRPLIDLALLARREVAWGLASQAVATAAYFAVLFTLALFLQQGLGRTAAYSGLMLVSWVVAFGVPGPLLARVSTRTRALAAPAGLVILGAGFAALSMTLYAGESGALALLGLLGVSGLGLGTAFSGMLSHLTSSVSGEQAADISGLFNTAARLGGVVGTAVFGTIYLALTAGAHPAISAFAVVNLILAATALIGAALAGMSIRRPGHVP